MSFDRRQIDGLAHQIGVESEMLQGGIWTQSRNGDTPSTTVLVNTVVKTQDNIPSRVNTVDIVGIDPAKLHNLLQFDNASNVVDEKDQESRPTLISVELATPRKAGLPFSLLIYERDKGVCEARFREELTPKHCIEFFRIVLFVMCHIPEVPFTPGLDFDLLQVNLAISIEDHHELPTWNKVRHHESSGISPVGVSLSHVEPMKAQGTIGNVVVRFGPEFI